MDPVEIASGVYSTGELQGIEQALAVKTTAGLVVIAGCSHPGVGPILEAASAYGRVYALVGGLHGFRQFDLLKKLDWVCPCHCTEYRWQIQELYPEKWLDSGAGSVIEV
jgi:7,8-dihydropterin-6-yl-methyl-4-(beta-D-ribofuranosyl)aminobenzene 5'-phosphate synthase